jgi:hypothetical protein
VAELLALATGTLKAMTVGCVEQRMKAVRAVAAQKVLHAIERVRTSLTPMRTAFLRARQQHGELLDELLGQLDECTATVQPHLPTAAEDSDDDYY